MAADDLNVMPTGEAVRVEGGLTLPRALELKTRLLAALANQERLSLDLSAVEEADVAGLQLLCSLHRSALAQGKGLVLPAQGRSGLLEDAIDAAGLRRHKGCAEDCLWKEGERG